MFIRIGGVQHFFGARWIKTAWCSTSSFSHGETATRPNDFSAGC
jgi:hypothetical protein